MHPGQESCNVLGFISGALPIGAVKSSSSFTQQELDLLSIMRFRSGHPIPESVQRRVTMMIEGVKNLPCENSEAFESALTRKGKAARKLDPSQ